MNPHKELVEYFFDEQEQVGHFTYENASTGEVTQGVRAQPMAKPEPDREKYFSELVVYLKTQDPYALRD